MVKVLDPAEGCIIGVYASEADVPAKCWNRLCTYAYPKEECDIVPVTDEKEKARLQRTMERCMREKGESR